MKTTVSEPTPYVEPPADGDEPATQKVRAAKALDDGKAGTEKAVR